jgi:hypothetical protein
MHKLPCIISKLVTYKALDFAHVLLLLLAILSDKLYTNNLPELALPYLAGKRKIFIMDTLQTIPGL